MCSCKIIIFVAYGYQLDYYFITLSWLDHSALLVKS